MKQRVSVLISLLCLVLMCLVPVVVSARVPLSAEPVYQPSSNAAATVVWLSPPDAQVLIGETVVVDIRINDVVGMYGAEVYISFDPNVVWVENIQDGEVWDTPNFSLTTWDNSAGEIQYVLTEMNPAEPFTGSGVMAHITFRGKNLGTSSLIITHCLLSDRDANPMYPSTSNGSVTVVQASPTPTYTPLATDTPTYTPIPTDTPTYTPIPTDTPTYTPIPTDTPTYTPIPTDTPTYTPVATDTPTYTPIPTDTPTYTPAPTNTPTLPTAPGTPTALPTNTPVPSSTPTATSTPTNTPTPTSTSTPLVWGFEGHVYVGEVGQSEEPLAGVLVELYGSDTADEVGALLDFDVTGTDGGFSLFHQGAGFRFFNIIESVPPGYITSGAEAGPQGVVRGDIWVQYENVAAAMYGDIAFYNMLMPIAPTLPPSFEVYIPLSYNQAPAMPGSYRGFLICPLYLKP